MAWGTGASREWGVGSGGRQPSHWCKLSGPLAFSDSRILALGFGPETFKIRPRRAGFQPSGPGETFVFPWRGRRLQPRVGGPGGGSVLAPSGCPGESSKFSILISPLQWPVEKGSRADGVLGRRGHAGYLKAVWPDFGGCVFEVWPASRMRSELVGLMLTPGMNDFRLVSTDRSA